MIEVAVVGIGGWGKNLARNYAQIPEANLRYVCDLDQDKLDQAHRQYPGARLTNKYEELLADPQLQAIVIATTAPRTIRCASRHCSRARTCTSRNRSCSTSGMRRS
jgi:predicted dehydrogenase